MARDRQGSSNALALPRVYARCLPEDALPRVASRSLGSACQAQARLTASRAEPWRTAGRCEPSGTMAVHSCRRGPRGSGLPLTSPCGLPRHVAARSRRGRDRLVNRPDLAGQRAHVGARPDADLMSEQGTVAEDAAGCRIFGSPAAPRPCPAGATAGEYGGRVPCGFGWAVPACLVGWSEPGNQAKGGEAS